MIAGRFLVYFGPTVFWEEAKRGEFTPLIERELMRKLLTFLANPSVMASNTLTWTNRQASDITNRRFSLMQKKTVGRQAHLQNYVYGT